MTSFRFDDALRPLNLTNGQFSLMMSLNRPKPASIGSVAHLLAMDRTTLTAAVKPLVRRRLVKVARQVSDLARLEIEVYKERNPRVQDCHVVEGTLYLKGVTLRARDASPEMVHSLNLMVDELARQVKRHRDKLRHRREAHAAAARGAIMTAASEGLLT